MKYESVNVAVCVPSGDLWMADFGKSLALMFSRFGVEKCKGVHYQQIGLLNGQGSMLSQQRELMVKKVLQNNYTHILFLDSDMTFPMDLPQRMLAHRKEFVAANCVTRKKPILPIAHDMAAKRISSKNLTGLQEVDRVGLAVAMIEVQAIKRISGPPLFLMDWIPALGVYCGEDVYFCQKLREVGVKLYVDHDVSKKIGHLGYREYSQVDAQDIEEEAS